MPTTSEIRRQFLEFFQSKGHRQVSSAPLVPKDDPTLLFTNAGMVQFKNPLLGLEKRDYNRAVTSQKCFRASGKHNDLENVGHTARHHTFFEMLGNFSFGNYFKEKAIEFCWELLTEVYGLPADKLWVSIHYSDDEAGKLWQDLIGVPPERIVSCGDKDNFWAMGDTGPCGPCSEVHIDQGPDLFDCPDPDNCGVECECDRVLELWNLVFMQYDRDASGNLTPLPAPSIDTGMGLERIAAVLQGKTSNYEIDLMMEIINHASGLCNTPYKQSPETDVSLRVIADHARALAFLIGDGILPSNDGRGYVLRRILRRAVRHGRVLGLDKPFLGSMIEVVGQVMEDQYPDILEGKTYIQKIVESEEKRFADTLDSGLRMLGEAIGQMKADEATVMSGDEAFKLYDTYGFPLDSIIDILRDENMTLDQTGFDRAMEEQRARSRAAWKGSGEKAAEGKAAELLSQGVETEFTGYEEMARESEVIAVIDQGTAEDGRARIDLVVDKTPFYAEAGGQAGDTGQVTGPDAFKAEVLNTIKYDGKLWVHQLAVDSGAATEKTMVALAVDVPRRERIMANHTATHLLHEALREILGEHVKQAGSSVTAERFRFDFTHFEALTGDQIQAVEARVNQHIWADLPITYRLMSMAEAQAEGAIALFEERYGETVRLVQTGHISKELCGGTHVEATGRIGLFKIMSDESTAAGVRRIEAVTGPLALDYLQAVERELNRAAQALSAQPGQLLDRIGKLQTTIKAAEKEIDALKTKLAQAASADVLAGIEEIEGVKVLAQRVEVNNPKELRAFADQIKGKLDSGVILLGAEDGKKAFLLALVTKDLQDRFPAGEVVKAAAKVVGGGGGGRKDMAQAGGADPSKLDDALASVGEMVRQG